MKTMHVKITFIDSVLGTASGNPEVHSDYIASKAPDAKSMEEEVAAIGADGVEQKQLTNPTASRGGCVATHNPIGLT